LPNLHDWCERRRLRLVDVDQWISECGFRNAEVIRKGLWLPDYAFAKGFGRAQGDYFA